MADLSFLLAQIAAVVALMVRHGGLNTEDMAVALAVILPCLLAQAAMLLPRVTGAQSFCQVGKRQQILAWALALVFAVIAVGFVEGRASPEKVFPKAWHFAVSLAGLEVVYGFYAAWFLQSRLVFNERKAAALRRAFTKDDFDVFLCHNSRDKADVKAVALRLMERGIKPWLDEWELRPGLRWQPALEEQVRQVKSAAVFVGAEGLGPWLSEEIGAFLSACVKRGIPVIPVLLPTAPSQPDLPVFLAERSWVDFRRTEPEPLDGLVFGITGEKVSAPAKPPRSTSSRAG